MYKSLQAEVRTDFIDMLWSALQGFRFSWGLGEGWQTGEEMRLMVLRDAAIVNVQRMCPAIGHKEGCGAGTQAWCCLRCSATSTGSAHDMHPQSSGRAACA